ncbi:MAG: hypothetical protein CMM52_10730 [Rhodospirillaceae bacterium]|nr:hypothetical protein [Rhodospirillaceae bacterium]
MPNLRVLAGFIFAPFLAILVSALIDNIWRPYSFYVGCGNNSWYDKFWCHLPRHCGESIFPSWLEPTIGTDYLLAWIIGLPIILLMKKFNRLSVTYFVSVGGLVSIAFNLALFYGSNIYVIRNLPANLADQFEKVGIWEIMQDSTDMVIDVGIYGATLGLSFWLIAVFRNPEF